MIDALAAARHAEGVPPANAAYIGAMQAPHPHAITRASQRRATQATRRSARARSATIAPTTSVTCMPETAMT